MAVKPLEIDSNRLQQQIDELAAISEAPPPVVTRILFSEADLRARAYIKRLCSELGLRLREDPIGNLFARWTGSEPTLPPLATGSHIDAIPNAGRYDGVVGVLGALEAFRALQTAGFQPKRSLELIVFTAEEPTRFGIGCLGSRLLAGTLSSEKLDALRDRDCRSLWDWLAHPTISFPHPTASGPAAFIDSVRLPTNSYAGFLELHIEQGPILERENISIGLVEKIAAPSTLQIEVTGEGGHAGAVLMPERRDALLAAAEIALAVERAALDSGSPDTVATTGVLRIEPGAVNSVPCRAWMEIDLRDTQLSTRDAALRQVEARVSEICQRRRVQFRAQRLNVDSPALCDEKLLELVVGCSRELGLTAKKMISRAYHDSLFMARICPTTMIFIPCRGGVSHRPDEFSSPEQIRDGVRVLAATLASLVNC